MIIDANVARELSTEHNDVKSTILLDKIMEEVIIPRTEQGYMSAIWEFPKYGLNLYNPVFKQVVEMLKALDYNTEVFVRYNYVQIKW